MRVGTLRPAIVLYDEPHPLGDDIATVQTADLSKRPDLLIVMGTSLKVHGLKKLVKEFAKAVHHGSPTAGSPTASPKVIFVNKTAPAGEWAGVIDMHIEGTTDDWVERVTKDWKKIRPADWEIQTTLKDAAAIKNVKSTIKRVDPNEKPSKPSKPKGDLVTVILKMNVNTDSFFFYLSSQTEQIRRGKYPTSQVSSDHIYSSTSHQEGSSFYRVYICHQKPTHIAWSCCFSYI